MLKNTQANKPSGTKEGFGHARFASKTRRGFKQGLPDLGTEAIIFLKLTPMQEHFRAKALGFTWSLLDVACMEKISFFCDFYGFGGIRSTQPTMLRGSFS